MTGGQNLAKRVASLLIAGGFAAFSALMRLLRLRAARTPVVLTYHSVLKPDLPEFNWQMRYLARTAIGVFADETTAGTSHRSVAVTFDDAFAHVFDWALPVCAELRLPVTVFVPTGYLGRTPGWFTVSTAVAAAGPVAAETCLRSLDSRSVRLGSHTVSHPRLANVDDVQLAEELVGSKQALEAITGETVTMLAAPFGSYDDRVIKAARVAGYSLVFANVPTLRRTGSTALAGRVNVSPSDWRLEFRLKVAGAYAWMALAVPAKRKIFRLLRAA